ncbi:MAG: 50S ribosomal protein L3 [Gammaproteobacteria bacterium]|nr:50S ribosomal protein L3 [Gammaproteobacteria bacterium]MYD79891.1 50S ribosomal protein L3 [Gammaproteobacteria bacterium]
MAIGIIGIKQGMTRVFDSDGVSVPVTVIHAEPNRVSQVKREESDSYDAVQLVHGSVKEQKTSRPMQGHFDKSSVSPGDYVREFRMNGLGTGDESKDPAQGDELSVNQFFEGQVVDVVGTSKGKGYAGVIKRWNFQRQDMSHGNSLAHRAPGSIGQCQTPGKVFKGKKMAGHMGNARVTVQNLKIVRLVEDRNLILVKGAVPGPTGRQVIVRPAAKVSDQTPPDIDTQESS